MQNLKNKKKLTGIVLVFMLVFIVGSAFAFAPGILDIVGTVNVAPAEEMYVIWSDVEVDEDNSVNAEQSAVIVDIRGRTAQRIEWAIDFKSTERVPGGVAYITATAINESILDAEITRVNLDWGVDWIDGNPSDFGLSVTVNDGAFLGTIASGATKDVLVELRWDGTIPDGFEVPDGEDYGFAGSFIIAFDYVQAP